MQLADRGEEARRHSLEDPSSNRGDAQRRTFECHRTAGLVANTHHHVAARSVRQARRSLSETGKRILRTRLRVRLEVESFSFLSTRRGPVEHSLDSYCHLLRDSHEFYSTLASKGAVKLWKTTR